MRTTFLPMLALTASLGAPWAAQAAFNPAVVPADARWVLHVDVATLRETELGKAMLTGLQQFAPQIEQGGLHPDFDKILAAAGTLTAYGSSFSKDPQAVDGTIVLAGTPEMRKIVEAFVLQGTVTEPEKFVELKGLPCEAYVIDGQISVAFPKEPVVIVSKSQAQLTRAYDVLRGNAATLAKNAASPLTGLLPKAGKYYLIAASVVPTESDVLPTEGPQARILRMATAGAIALGEEDSMTAARVQLVASSDDMANKLDRILQGMIALFALTGSDDAQLQEFLKTLAAARDGNKVSFSISYPSARLLDLVNGLQRKAAERAEEASRGESDEDESRPAAPASTDGMSVVIGSWLADRDLAGASPAAENVTSRTFDGVVLKQGAMITITGRRGGGEHARLDYVEIAPPTGGGPAARYEAEFMRLDNYRIEKLPFASGGEAVRLNDGRDDGNVRFPYQGADGTYRVTVGYIDESDGRSSFALGVLGAAGPEAPKTSTP